MTHLNIIFVSALLHEDGHDLPAILEHAMACNPSRTLRSLVLFSAGSAIPAIDREALQARRELTRISESAHYHDTMVLNEQEVQEHRLSERAVVQRVRLGMAQNLLKQCAFGYS